MMRAMSCFQMPGRSCPREMRPVPIAPMLMRLLGDVGAEAPTTARSAGNPDTTDGADDAFARCRQEVAPRWCLSLLAAPGLPVMGLDASI